MYKVFYGNVFKFKFPVVHNQHLNHDLCKKINSALIYDTAVLNFEFCSWTSNKMRSVDLSPTSAVY